MLKVNSHMPRPETNYMGFLRRGRVGYAAFDGFVPLLVPYSDHPHNWKIAPGTGGRGEALTEELFIPRPLYLH